MSVLDERRKRVIKDCSLRLDNSPSLFEDTEGFKTIRQNMLEQLCQIDTDQMKAEVSNIATHTLIFNSLTIQLGGM